MICPKCKIRWAPLPKDSIMDRKWTMIVSDEDDALRKLMYESDQICWCRLCSY